MEYRRLGRSSIEVSVICQGCWSVVTADSTWGGNDLNDSIAAVRAAFDEPFHELVIKQEDESECAGYAVRFPALQM